MASGGAHIHVLVAFGALLSGVKGQEETNPTYILPMDPMPNYPTLHSFLTPASAVNPFHPSVARHTLGSPPFATYGPNPYGGGGMYGAFGHWPGSNGMYPNPSSAAVAVGKNEAKDFPQFLETAVEAYKSQYVPVEFVPHGALSLLSMSSSSMGYTPWIQIPSSSKSEADNEHITHDKSEHSRNGINNGKEESSRSDSNTVHVVLDVVTHNDGAVPQVTDKSKDVDQSVQLQQGTNAKLANAKERLVRKLKNRILKDYILPAEKHENSITQTAATKETTQYMAAVHSNLKIPAARLVVTE
mmetsp:Transcript_2887/g.4215  ORF Transcript_2887/g.4215 Transcript_2887/m.4215 type:complete len:300 (-) Transcript_2887:95-994(-)